MRPPSAAALLLLLASLARVASRDAGILYEVWHTRAAHAMAAVRAKGLPQLTTELVIASQDTAAPFSLDDVYRGAAADIWGAQPALGFYCLWRARAGDPPPSPPMDDCLNISATVRAHAQMLLEAGIDYAVRTRARARALSRTGPRAAHAASAAHTSAARVHAARASPTSPPVRVHARVHTRPPPRPHARRTSAALCEPLLTPRPTAAPASLSCRQ
jgi:hypothetical protein